MSITFFNRTLNKLVDISAHAYYIRFKGNVPKWVPYKRLQRLVSKRTLLSPN